jgi:hypothetical protein
MILKADQRDLQKINRVQLAATAHGIVCDRREELSAAPR